MFESKLIAPEPVWCKWTSFVVITFDVNSIWIVNPEPDPYWVPQKLSQIYTVIALIYETRSTLILIAQQAFCIKTRTNSP